MVRRKPTLAQPFDAMFDLTRGPGNRTTRGNKNTPANDPFVAKQYRAAN
jgi:hypothetical protein